MLNSATLGRATSIMWHWRNVYDAADLEAKALEGTNGRIPSHAGTLHLDDYLLHSVGHGHSTGILSYDLSRIGGRLARSAKIAFSRA